MTIWIDATSTLGSEGLHGISRVEREMIRACLDRPGVQFFRLFPLELVPVPSNDVRAIIESEAATGNLANQSDSVSRNNILLTMIQISRSFWLGASRGIYRHFRNHVLQMIRLLRSLSPNNPSKILKAVTFLRLLGKARGRQLRPLHGTVSGTKFSLSDDFAFGDWLVFVSPFWKFVDEAQLGKAARRKGVRLSVMVPDLVPINMPHVSFRPHLRHYARFFSLLPWIADDLVVNSFSVQRDVLELVNKAGVTPIEARLVGLGGDHVLRHTSQPIPTLLERPYFLLVSTIEPRKNFKVVLEAYRRFLRKADANVDLVIVGHYGWACDEIRNTLELDPELTSSNSGRVRVLSYVQDAGLRWLYENCIGLLCPSLHEGFGLSVAEALTLGTQVRISAGGALPEFEPYGAKLVGWSSAEWLAEMELLSSIALKANLKSGRPPSWTRTWADVADEWLNDLDSEFTSKG